MFAEIRMGAFFGVLGMGTFGCAGMGEVRYVYQDGQSGVIGLPENTSRWPTYYRKHAEEMMAKHFPQGYEIVRAEEGVEGSRVLVPSCARAVEDEMVVHTDSEKVQHSRKMVLELLASSVDMSQADPDVARWMTKYGVDPTRYGPPAEPFGVRLELITTEPLAAVADRLTASGYQLELDPDGVTVDPAGITVVDPDGQTVGTVTDVFADQRTMEPLWAVITHGRIRHHHYVVPAAYLHDDSGSRDQCVIDMNKDACLHAPEVGEHDPLTPALERTW